MIREYVNQRQNPAHSYYISLSLPDIPDVGVSDITPTQVTLQEPVRSFNEVQRRLSIDDR